MYIIIKNIMIYNRNIFYNTIIIFRIIYNNIITEKKSRPSTLNENYTGE